MRPILCVVDLTDSTGKVLKVAARAALAHKSRLNILFPYRLIDYGYKGEISFIRKSIEEKASSDFAQIKEQVSALDQVAYEFKPGIGFTADVITAHIKRNKTEMIIIGHRQANAINETYGMTLENLISNLKLPFTIVPEEADIEILST
jgi:hypothetical protein